MRFDNIVTLLDRAKLLKQTSLGKGANNQNGNLRWYLPLGVDPPKIEKKSLF